MSDNLVNRLRGIYEIGENGELGNRDFSDFIPPISLEAATEIERLGDKIKLLEDDLKSAQECDI